MISFFGTSYRHFEYGLEASREGRGVVTKPFRVSIALYLYRMALRLVIEDLGLVNKINRIMVLMILMSCQG